MSTAQVLDTHRLMYRNARLRAISLSDRTTPIQFLNVTDDDTAAEIGNIVYTDGCGYVFYGANHRRVSCLAVAESAIVQVDLHNNDNWNDIEWIVRVEDGSEFVRVDGVGKVIDANGNLLWNPLAGDWNPFPDFMRRDEFTEGEWAEGEMTVTDTTPKQLNVDKWTHTIIVGPGHAGEYEISIANGRAGQCIAIVNVSDTLVTITETHAGGSSSETIGPKGAIVAVRSISANQWVLRAFDEGESVAGYALRYQRINGDNDEWLSSCRAKCNDRPDFTHDPDSDRYLPPYTVAFTASGNKIMYLLPSNGKSEEIAGLIAYDGDGVWKWTTNVSPDPRYIQVISIDETSFPDDNKFGSYNGTNTTEFTLPMVPGEELHVILRTANRIDFPGGVSRNFIFKINHCTVLDGTSNAVLKNDVLVSGTLKCCRWLDNSRFYTFKKDDTAGR